MPKYRVATPTPWTHTAGQEPAANGDVIELADAEAVRVTKLNLGIALTAVDAKGDDDKAPSKAAQARQAKVDKAQQQTEAAHGVQPQAPAATGTTIASDGAAV